MRRGRSAPCAIVAAGALMALGCPVAQAAGFNDGYAERVPIALGSADTRSNVGATIERGEPLTAHDPAGAGCGIDGSARAGAVRLEASLWWEFEGTGGPVTVSTAGSTFDTILAVYDTTSRALLGCHDDVGKAVAADRRVTSELTRQTTAGRRYAVQVGGCVAAFRICTTPTSGDATLRVSAAPRNDDRASPTVVSAAAAVAATNIGATLQGGEVSACAGQSRFAKTVWFRYTAPTAGTATFAVAGINSVMAIYRGDAPTPLSCNDDAVVGQAGASRVPQSQPAQPPLAVLAGDYLIQVGGYYDDGLGGEAARDGPISLQVVFTADEDLDDDGFQRGVDCDDDAPAIHPGAAEISNNAVDENCDALTAFDGDGDGVLAPPLGADCRDDSADIRPGAAELLGNGVDENCDGLDGVQQDRDGDGVLDGVYGPDCAPDDARIRPGVADVAENGVDEDCDGADATVPVLRATIAGQWRNYGSYTDAVRLRVLDAAADSTIELRCRGRRCPFRTRQLRVEHNQDVSVLKRIGGRLRLRAGSRLEVRVMKPRFTGIGRVYRILRGSSKAPSFRDYCVRRHRFGPCP